MRNFDDTVYQETVKNLANPNETIEQEDTDFNIAIGIKSIWNFDIVQNNFEFDQYLRLAIVQYEAYEDDQVLGTVSLEKDGVAS